MGEAVFLVLGWFPTFVGLLFTLLPLWDRIYLEDETPVFSTIARKAIVICGAAISLPVTGSIAWLVFHLWMQFHPSGLRNSEGQHFGAFLLATISTLVSPLAIGSILAMVARRLNEAGREGRGLFVLNWLGVGITHGLWCFPIAFGVYMYGFKLRS